MTLLDQTTIAGRPSRIAFRLATTLFAGVLGLQCIWLLLAELARTNVFELPTDATAATTAAKQRDAASVAASVGVIRGGLWAESAFTYANLIFAGTGEIASTERPKTLARARASLDHALVDAPSRSSVWLLLAGLASHFPSLGIEAAEALKMSYYTGPNEQHLMSLRLSIAVQVDRFNDIEMRQFVGQDLRLLLARQQKSAIAEAYNAASPAGRSFIEQTVKEVDPSALNSLRTGALRQSVPD